MENTTDPPHLSHLYSSTGLGNEAGIEWFDDRRRSLQNWARKLGQRDCFGKKYLRITDDPLIVRKKYAQVFQTSHRFIKMTDPEKLFDFLDEQEPDHRFTFGIFTKPYDDPRGERGQLAITHIYTLYLSSMREMVYFRMWCH